MRDGNTGADLLERARRLGTPLIADGRAIFVWAGSRPPLVLGDFYGWMGLEMAPVSPGVWTLAVDLPRDAYCEYVLMLEGEAVLDPFNRRRTPNGFGRHNHYFYMPEASATPFTRARKGLPAGKVTRYQVDSGEFLGSGKRGVWLYAPAAEGPYPLAVVYDGREYLERARLPAICDQLIAQGRMEPLALALIENHPQRRSLEYACSEGTLGFVLDKVLPLARNELNLADPAQNPGSYGVIGASYGGLMALYTGLRLGELFGRVLAQSGAHILDGYRFPVWDLARLESTARPRVWMDAGSFEHLLGCNREMQAHLRGNGFDVLYREYAGGHNYTVWRNDLPRGLAWLWGRGE